VTKIIVIGEDYSIYVPNAFSPNSDGTNDSFGAKGEGVKDFKMYIFDRWGNQVFFSDAMDKWWDGRFQSKGTDIVQEDVYVWKIEVKDFKGAPHLLKGTVTLIK
jgi:gliding motility-associated-like protein